MRITIYTHEFLPFSGGIATYCDELASGLRTIGNDVSVVAPLPINPGLVDVPYRVDWIKGARFRTVEMLQGVMTLLRASRNFRPDVILATNRYALLSLAVFGLGRTPISVPIVHGSEILIHSSTRTIRRRIVSWAMARYYRSRSLVICVSSYVRELFLCRFSLRDGHVMVVHNGMRNQFRSDLHSGDSVRKRFDIPREAMVLLTLARLVPRKGQDIVIRALPQVIRTVGGVIYMCVGEGPYREGLSRLARDYGVADRVIFTGRVPDVAKYSFYAACDLFVMVSRQHGDTVEGFGLSFLEAWHAGKAVLGGRHGGVLEVIEDGVDGKLVNPESLDDVASGLLSAIGNVSRLAEMGRKGRVKASKIFTEENMAVQVVRALRVGVMGDRE